MRFAYSIIFLLIVAGCYDASQQLPTKKKSKKNFKYKETIVTGKDTGMHSLSRFRTSHLADALCQRWIGGYESDLDEFSLFKDSTALLNPRTRMLIGKWRVEKRDADRILVLHFPNAAKAEFLLQDLKARSLFIAAHGGREGIMVRQYESDGTVHQNMYNDPFHPINNQWRIAPKKAETDSAIKRRVRQCVKFYALYFRDNIKRQQRTISFKGLPTVFTWYSRGIGLAERKDLSTAWIDCFYDQTDAEKGWDLLRGLIINYEFNWPKGAPNWVYETHSVLEQMYHKLE